VKAGKKTSAVSKASIKAEAFDRIERPKKTPPAVKPKDRWGGDVIVDMMQRYQLPYATLNPGASYRGLHDSIVNYGGNSPEMMLCQHEETAVQVAHGYAKASGKPMVAILHNLVGLLHANMAVYYAYIDRVPVYIVGATGPMDETKRRPRIDWIHSAQTQGAAVRDYTKWDYQPTTVDGVPEAFARGYSVMMTEPRGPVYMCYDAWLQEKKLEHAVPLPPKGFQAVPSRIAPDPAALQRAAQTLALAKRPVILTEYAGRDPQGFYDLVALAETLGAPVYDLNMRLNFPSNHPLNLSMDKTMFEDADAVLLVGEPGTQKLSVDRHGFWRHEHQRLGHGLPALAVCQPAHRGRYLAGRAGPDRTAQKAGQKRRRICRACAPAHGAGCA
jgi:acetolactate synthase I/II/III large subunit